MSDKAVSGIFPVLARSAQVPAPPRGRTTGKPVPEAGNASPPPQGRISNARLDALVERLNLRSVNVSPSLRFQVDIQSGTSVIQVFDRVSGELIRQIPPEKAAALENNASPIDLTGIDELV